MAELDFIPRETLSHLEPGSYEGKVIEITIDNKRKSLWFQIDIDEVGVLNTPMSLNSSVLNRFAIHCVNTNGKFDTDLVINKTISIELIDNKIGDNTYSQITAMHLIETE